jgi:phosphoenolpyruvate carboxylase
LSTLPGDVLAAQPFPDALETVERVRTSAIASRREGIEPRSSVRAELEGLDPETAEIVARAFTTLS